MKAKLKNFQEYLFWLGLLLLLFIACWQLISNFYHQQVISQQETYLERKGKFLIDLTQDEEEPLQRLANLDKMDSHERITILDSAGDVVFDTYGDSLSKARAARPEIKAILNGSSKGIALRHSPTLNEELLYVALPINVDNQLKYILRIAEPTQTFSINAENIKHSILLVYCILCFVISFLVIRLLQKKNHPIDTVLPVLKKMVTQPNTPELIMQNNSKTADLYEVINELSQKMQQTYLAYTASEKQLAVLLNELTIGIFFINTNGTLESLNNTIRKQLGITNYKLQQPFVETITDTQLIQLIYQANQQKTVHEELTIAKTNKILDITIRHFPESQQMIGLAYDITKIRQLEKVQKDFVGNVSHELKTPVTSLIGFTETLLDGAKEDPETLTAFLEIMQKDAHRLEVLIQEIIHLSKTSDTYDYQNQILTINDLLTQLVKSYQKPITDKQLNLHIDCSKHLKVKTKRELFYAIIKNLTENAINYSPNNGKITIQCKLENHLFIFTIKDQGLGIDIDDQQRIFERFYRVDKARTRNSGGTGLGLAIVKDYTEALNGTIELSSHLGAGSTFTIRLPIVEE